MRTNSLSTRVLRSIKSQGRGRAFCAKSFLRLGGSQTAVNRVLSRLHAAGKIRREAQGIYSFPKVHPRFGEVPVRSKELAAAMALKRGHELQPSASALANSLGLSTQVPAREVYLTTGSGAELGNGRVVFRRGPPGFELGSTEGQVYQLLQYCGEELTEAEVERVRRGLDEKKLRRLKTERFPQRMRATVKELAGVSA